MDQRAVGDSEGLIEGVQNQAQPFGHLLSAASERWGEAERVGHTEEPKQKDASTVIPSQTRIHGPLDSVSVLEFDGDECPNATYTTDCPVRDEGFFPRGQLSFEPHAVDLAQCLKGANNPGTRHGMATKGGDVPE